MTSLVLGVSFKPFNDMPSSFVRSFEQTGLSSGCMRNKAPALRTRPSPAPGDRRFPVRARSYGHARVPLINANPST